VEPEKRVSFSSLVRENVDFVWRTLRRYGVTEADVDDATQQVFLVANDKIDNIRAGSERAFLLAVAARVASHARRSSQRRLAAEQRLSEHQQTEGPPVSPIDPEHLTLRLQARELLDRVLDDMPDNMRSVFVLFELEELKIAEVAELLALPRGTVATRLRKARELFQKGARRLLAQQANGGGP
jgi:RNA polymerase sigma-70 factor (ECF subfamily)